MTRHRPSGAAARGFTMIELIVVMTLIGLLVSMALPRYLGTLERGREQIIAHDLATMRQAIDRHYGDRGAYPDRLEDLVTRRYLRAIPPNPRTDAADWLVIAPPAGARGMVYDVRDPADPEGRGPQPAGAAAPPPEAAASEAP
ncbi:MAG: type II secretion system protein [Proteobacteria bacterium]|nr:type II secretion system protein [Pseudomonadota bacterium]